MGAVVTATPDQKLAELLLIVVISTGLFGPTPAIKRLFRDADLILAVGGGYLRGGSLLESAKSWGAHFGQLALAAKYGDRAVYLPQSIGPFRGVYAYVVARKLARMATVFVRDDRSQTEFSGCGKIRRAPDLAILELAKNSRTERLLATDQRPVFVARPIIRPRRYYDLLASVSTQNSFEWAVQSTAGANNDMPLTERFSPSSPRMLREILDEGTPRVVVSTRLHGSLSALIAGYPSIHLSYERKGWGAFDDLGLSHFVLSARDTSIEEINSLIWEIEASPGEYWQRIAESRIAIQAHSDHVLRVIRDVARLEQ